MIPKDTHTCENRPERVNHRAEVARQAVAANR